MNLNSGWPDYHVECDREVALLKAEIADLKEKNKALLVDIEQALNDWILTYAAELCAPPDVDAAWKRISERGGTLAYVANLRQRILAEIWGR